MDAPPTLLLRRSWRRLLASNSGSPPDVRCEYEALFSRLTAPPAGVSAAAADASLTVLARSRLPPPLRQAEPGA